MLSLFNRLILSVFLFIFGGQLKEGWHDDKPIWDPERRFSDPIWLPEQESATWWVVAKWVYGSLIFGTLWVGKYYFDMDFSHIRFAEFLEVTGVLAFLADTFAAFLIWIMSLVVFTMTLMAVTEPIWMYCNVLFRIERSTNVRYLAGSDGKPSAYFYEPTDGLCLVPNELAKSKWCLWKVPVVAFFTFITVSGMWFIGILFPICMSFGL